jgi:hypothetical protein
LHLAAQALAFGQAGHDLKRVTEDHSVRPVLVVLVKLGFVHALWNAVEVGKEIRRGRSLVMLALLRGAPQVIDEHLGVNLFLDVERRNVDDEVTPVLLILPAPDDLGIEVGIGPSLGRSRNWLPSPLGSPGFHCCSSPVVTNMAEYTTAIWIAERVSPENRPTGDLAARFSHICSSILPGL